MSSSLVALIRAMAEEKSASVETNVVDEFPPFEEMTDRVIIGDFSMTALQSKKRWIARDVYLSPFGFPQTPTELTRFYLKAKYKFPLPIRSANAEIVSTPRPSPLFATPVRGVLASYIDIKSAYWQIVKAVGWDVEYFPKRYLSKKSSMSDAPEWIAKNKLAYVGLVSIARPTTLSVWTGSKLISERTFNGYLNMRLVSLVSDILNGVAREIMERIPKVYYVNTDGYIVDDLYVREAVEILQSWGLNYSVKASGKTEITGVGAYRVGRKRSARSGDERSFNNIEPIDYHWLRRNFYPFTRGEPIIEW